ncbi:MULTISPECIES: NAD(P)-dependent oxidoreductase [Rhodomicrobium]|uniref:NAD-dependent epimerase/dehydratase family protein n=1 Tax=Rhodomicrobium TaxID=1068 RepID=UPI000B4B643B|nr:MULTISPECIES: NAD(P)-dependent oxidoreductase [Rhodomicrobium]
MLMLITGPTGKVGQTLIAKALADPRLPGLQIRALCHNRPIAVSSDRVSTVRGSIASREVVREAMRGVTHVVHLATCKETPDDIMDVTVKGLFWLLEEMRESRAARQFILVGGDAAVGHFHVAHAAPVTEATPHHAYPGCYALSKVLEEAMLAQYYLQYDLNGCCLRAPWIMEKDDFRYTLSFGEDVFGAPVWKDLVPANDAARYREDGTVPCLHDADGRPLKRNFVHVDDLVDAIIAAVDHPRARQQLFNIAMTRPIDYGEVADYLAATRGLKSVPIHSALHSNWLDNSKARFLLDWEPAYDMENLIEAAWSFERSSQDRRKVWYPG